MIATRTLLLALLLATLCETRAGADQPGVADLLKQAHYWEVKGRGDMASKAYARVLTISPNNPEAKAALAGLTQKPVSPQKPAARPKQAPPGARSTRPPLVDPGGRERVAGYAALDGGNQPAAATHFRAALRVRSNDPDALGGLGIVMLQQKRFAEARDLLTRASTDGPSEKWSEALASARFYADLEKAQREFKAAHLQQAEVLARALAQSTFADKMPASTLLADILSAEGRSADALALYSQLGAAGSDDAAQLRAKAAREQARQAEQRGDLAGAFAAFQAAIAAAPSDLWLRYDDAVFLLDHGQKQLAVMAMAQVPDRSTADALYAAALFARRIGSPRDAAALLDQIAPERLTPAMKALLVDLKMDEALARIRTLQAQGNLPAALAGARDLANSPHASIALLGSVADLLLGMGDSADATAIATQVIARPLADPADYQSLVSVLARTGHEADASTLISRFADQGGSTTMTARLGAILAANQADSLRLAGQNAAAFDVLRAAWSSAPSDKDILASLARLYQQGGLPTQAEQVYVMLLTQNPDDLPSLIGLAGAAAAAHDFGRARDAALRAIALAPQDPAVYLAAADAAQAKGDRSAALRYLKRARALSQSNVLAEGIFPTANPFGPSPEANSFAGSSAASGNPFSPRPSPALLAADGDESNGALTPYLAPPRRARTLSVSTSLGMSQPAVGEGPVGVPSETGTDPTLSRIDQEILQLSGDTGPTATATTHFRNRTGESGLSALNDLGATLSVSAHVGGAKITASAAAVVLDAGGLSRSAEARFGTNPTAEAIGIQQQEPSALVAVQTQHDAGIAPSIALEDGAFKADVGTTPFGFRKTNLQGGVSLSPKLGEHLTISVQGDRRPVTDSVLSYAGTVDPVSARAWGSVVRTGGKGAISFDYNGSGIYADGTYHILTGQNVNANHSIEGNLGGYLHILGKEHTSLSVGANINYQTYGNNQNYFSFGHGGYFSPQSFVSIAFPLHYKNDHGKWKLSVDLSPGFQSYQEDQVAVYPTTPDEQAELVLLKSLNSDVRATYDSLSKSGFGFSGAVNGFYRMGAATLVGGEIKYDTFGAYHEAQALLSIRQSLNGGGQ